VGAFRTTGFSRCWLLHNTKRKRTRYSLYHRGFNNRLSIPANRKLRIVPVARYHLNLGDHAMHISTVLEAEIILTWGYRLLYLIVFMFGMVSMFYLYYPPTVFYLGAVLSLFYIALIWENYQGKEEEEREVTETNHTRV